MEKFYFKIIIIFCLIFIILVVNSHVFASSIVAENVDVQQDITALALRDIQTTREIIASDESLRNIILSFNSTDLCYAITPSLNPNSSDLVLLFYRKSWITGLGNDVNYYGIMTTSFNVSSFSAITLSRGGHSDSVYYPSTSRDLPSFFYLRSIVELTEGLDSNSSIVSSVDENTNAVKENTEVSKDTQNFLKDDSQVADSEITGMTNSFDDLDNIQDTGSDNIGNVFDLFSDNRNSQGQPFSFSLNVPFTNENLNITIDNNLTRNTLLSLCGGSTSVQGIIILCIQFLWSFFIFKFIVINLISLIDKIRTGDITNIRTRNVLVDVL